MRAGRSFASSLLAGPCEICSMKMLSRFFLRAAAPSAASAESPDSASTEEVVAAMHRPASVPAQSASKPGICSSDSRVSRSAKNATLRLASAAAPPEAGGASGVARFVGACSLGEVIRSRALSSTDDKSDSSLATACSRVHNRLRVRAQ